MTVVKWIGSGLAALLVVAAVVVGVAFQRRTVPVPPLDDCAGVVRVVGEERVSDEDLDRVASGLGPCLDVIGDVAMVQYESTRLRIEGDFKRLSRPRVTDMFKVLTADKTRRDRLRSSVLAWSEVQLASFSKDAPVSWAKGRHAVSPLVHILASISNAIDQVDTGAGPRFVEQTVDEIKVSVATRIAEQTGRPMPNPDEIDGIIEGRFPPSPVPADSDDVGDRGTPFDYLSEAETSLALKKLQDMKEWGEDRVPW